MTPTEIAKWLEAFFVRNEEYRPGYIQDGAEFKLHLGDGNWFYRVLHTRISIDCRDPDALNACTLAVEEWVMDKTYWYLGRDTPDEWEYRASVFEEGFVLVVSAPTRLLADIEAVKKIEGESK